MPLTWSVYCDFNYAGGFSYDFTSAEDDITDYVQNWSVSSGAKDDKTLVASIGSASIVLDNSDKRFSPAYTGGPYYSRLTIGKPVKIVVQDEDGVFTRFLGFIQSITPEGGLAGRILSRTVVIKCEDLIGLLQSNNVGLPLMENVTGDVIVKAAINAALNAPVATNRIAVNANPANGETLTINGVVNTFKNTLSGGADEILIGSDPAATAENIYRRINRSTGASTQYSAAVTDLLATAEQTSHSYTNYGTANQDSGVDLNKSNTSNQSVTCNAGNGPVGYATGANQGYGNTFYFPYANGKLDTVDVLFNANTGSPSGSVTWSLYPASGNTTPSGGLIASGTFTPTPSANNTITINATLPAAGYYFIGFTPTSAQAAGVRWNLRYSTGASGYYASRTYDGGGSWSYMSGFSLYMTFNFSQTAYSKLAQQFKWDSGRTINTIRLWLKKTGSPVGNLTLTLENDLHTQIAVSGTVAESSLSTSYGWVAFTFSPPLNCDLTRIAFFTLTTSRAASASNYVTWGGDNSSPSYGYGADTFIASWVFNSVFTYCFDFGAELITLKAKVYGSIGNTYTLATTSAGLALDGATFSGGVDYPPSGWSIDTGKTTFYIAGDKWSKDRTNALSIIKEVTDSERGRFYCKGDGTLVWENRDKLYLPIISTPVADLNSDYARVTGGMEQGGIGNKVKVSYTPRSTLATGVIAKSNSVIRVPPYGSISTPVERFNTTDTFTDPQATVIRLPFIDPATGERIGAKSLVLPLTPYTDIRVTDTEDGTGFDYTNYLKVAIAYTANEAEIQFINHAIGNLYVNLFQIRGVGLTSYNQNSFIQEDTAAQHVAGVKQMSIELPLPVPSDYAKNLAIYLLARFKSAVYRIVSLAFGDLDNGRGNIGYNLLKLELGSVITITDDQLGLDTAKYRVIGYSGGIGSNKVNNTSLIVTRLDDKTFWLLGNATYGKLGGTTRLAI